MGSVFFKGFTAQGLLGYGLMIGGIYSLLANLMESDNMEQSDKARKLLMARLRLLRWGIGGIGTFLLGFYMLFRADNR